MGWWILGFMFAVVAVGYVAHKYPTLFGAVVDEGAAVVNAIDAKIKPAPAPVANTVAANTATH